MPRKFVVIKNSLSEHTSRVSLKNDKNLAPLTMQFIFFYVSLSLSLVLIKNCKWMQWGKWGRWFWWLWQCLSVFHNFFAADNDELQAHKQERCWKMLEKLRQRHSKWLFSRMEEWKKLWRGNFILKHHKNGEKRMKKEIFFYSCNSLGRFQ